VYGRCPGCFEGCVTQRGANGRHITLLSRAIYRREHDADQFAQRRNRTKKPRRLFSLLQRQRLPRRPRRCAGRGVELRANVLSMAIALSCRIYTVDR
jgi:hypothetical protein